VILKDREKFLAFDEYGYYHFDFSDAKVLPKLTSSVFPVFLEVNKFKTVGAGLLERLKMLDEEKEFDPYYKVRGAVAEMFTLQYMIEIYKEYKNIDITALRFSPKQKNFDMFPKDTRFGGVVDIGISKPEEERAVLEVKGKSMKDYDKIITNGQVPEEELWQGKLLAYKSQTQKLFMCYVFFDERQEAEMQRITTDILNRGLNMEDYVEDKINDIIKSLSFTHNSVEIRPLKYIIEIKDVKEAMESAWELYETLYKNQKIYKGYFSNKEQAYLNTMLSKAQQDKLAAEEDLPF